MSEPAPAPRPKTILFGPFLRLLAPLPFGIMVLLLGGFGLHDCGTTQTLTCERRDGRPRCELLEEGLRSTTRTVFEGSRLRGAETTVSSSGKGKASYAIALIDERGARRQVMTQTAQGDGELVAAFLKNPAAPPLQLHRPRSVLGVLGGVGVIVAGLVMLGMGWRGTLLLVLRPDPDRRELRVIHTRLGVPYRRRTLQLPAEVVRVEVDVTNRKSSWSARHEAPKSFGRILIHGRGGPPLEVIDRELPGIGLHRRVAAKLASALGCSGGPAPLIDLEGGRSPRPAWWRSLGLKAPRWKVIAAMVGVLGIYFAVMLTLENRGTGRLDVRCEHRCRMGTTECLPGGSYSMPIQPGLYKIEVWAPSWPSGWEPFTIGVEEGQTTEFVCRPSR